MVSIARSGQNINAHGIMFGQNINSLQMSVLHHRELASFNALHEKLLILTMILGAGPSGIPGYPGIPGLNSNPDPGILENIIPGFLGIYHIKQNHDFKDFYWFLNLIFPKNPGIKI